MDTKSRRPKGGDSTLSSLNITIEALNLAKEVCGITPAKIAFGSVSALLTMIRVRFFQFCNNEPRVHMFQDSMINERDYVELGLSCADICTALDRGLNGRRVNELNQSVLEAIQQLTMWVEPAIRTLGGSLTKLLTPGLLQKYKGRLSNRTSGMRPFDFFIRRMIRRRLPLGSQTSVGSFRSLTYVQSILPAITNTFTSDGVGN